MCPVTFQTVPCQQQTTAALRIKQCHTEMDRNPGAVSRLHLFNLVSKVAGKYDRDFPIFSTSERASPFQQEHVL